MVKTYSKLVLDRIPEIIQNNSPICRTKQLTDEEYIETLDAKLQEECAE
jgi:predicted house-cleaning noncanonical NTP pyrophosphatase (MazG superfamily)